MKSLLFALCVVTAACAASIPASSHDEPPVSDHLPTRMQLENELDACRHEVDSLHNRLNIRDVQIEHMAYHIRRLIAQRDSDSADGESIPEEISVFSSDESTVADDSSDQDDLA